ncbi:proline-, glutamic acid- and leucine-rich protein 1-like [Macrosteles quadrilineatus]|uniref:proline-, glutamic acid- and leucine-rich protein 1-like n=1 Tax=Macrosteles quadrilineatus TaxID=74068 RepID=UPI0023E0B2E4|nr:proline-, glutamic acid- and leucine-rich protein 1-like [Macrosteles quadrilineatus]
MVSDGSRYVSLVAGVGGGGKQGVSHKTAWRRQQLGLVSLLHSLLNRLYKHVDCHMVSDGSRCVSLVAGVGGGGKLGVSHKTAWRRRQLGLVSLLHSLLNRLYEHVDCHMVSDGSRYVSLVAGVGGGGKQGVSHKTAWRRQQLGLVSLLHSLLNRLYEHVDCHMVSDGSRYVSLVAGVGGGGKQGVSHKTAWRRQQLGLVSLLHSLLNRLYEHVDCHMEESATALEDIELSLEPVNEKNILIKSQRLATQFSAVALFLQAMLLETFPVAKAVAPDVILDVVAHAQKATLATLGSTREALAVTAVLPTVQIASLRLLESLVMCLGRNLVPHGGLVGYLCSQVIHWSHQKHSDWPYAMIKPYSQTRHVAYCCLQSWLSVAGAASQLDTVVDKLLPPLLADIHAEKPSVRLRVGSKASKGKKRQQVLVSDQDRSEKLRDETANHRLCERALLTLDALVGAAVSRLKPDVISSITETVLRLVADLPVPYSHVNCLTALYQLLFTLCVEPHPRLVPPLPQAITAFTAGSHHPFGLVRQTCTAALRCLDRIIHPTAASLYFPVIQVETDDQDEENPPLKKMRIEPPNETQSKTMETEENEMEHREIVLEKEIKITECTLADSETIELVHLDHPKQVIDIAEGDDEDNEIEVVDITGEDENVSSTSNGAEEGTWSQSGGTEVGESSQTADFEEKGTRNDGVYEKAKTPPYIRNEDELDSTGVDAEKDQDADVSQMLMDFNDEVNDMNYAFKSGQ